MRFGQQNSLNLVAMGDSQTAERSALGGAKLEQTYAFLMASAKGYGAVTNVGISGETTTQMLARFGYAVLAHRPGAVSIMGLVNDMSANVSGGVWLGTGSDAGGRISLATTKSNLKSMIQAAQAQRAKVTLLSPCPIREAVYVANVAPYRAMLADLVSETQCIFVDVYAALIALSTPTLDALYIDTQHPNAAGHAFIRDLSLATSGAFGQFT